MILSRDNIDLVKQVMSLQSQVQEIQDENRILRDRAREAEEKLGFAGSLEFRAPFYLSKEDPTPFCARCWEVDRRAVHLKEDWNGRRWECYQCGKVYLVGGTASPKAALKV